MRVEEKVSEVLWAIKIICDDLGVKIQGNSNLKQLAYFLVFILGSVHILSKIVSSPWDLKSLLQQFSPLVPSE